MKRIAIIVRTNQLPRAREALRAAVGLSLRGDQLIVRGDVVDASDPDIARALATLAQLGHDTAVDAPLADARDADAVEVWT